MQMAMFVFSRKYGERGREKELYAVFYGNDRPVIEAHEWVCSTMAKQTFDYTHASIVEE